MAGSLPDSRWQMAALLAGTIDLYQFHHWFIMNETAIEQCGTDDELDFSNRVENLLAEYTGDHISADQLIEALREESELRAPEREFMSTSSS
jgi:hypothetical protein